ncbi:hypothetical protein [Rickettsiella massiliensis]|uniref:hypothetical protein n=1 Tax=Rickettsiella massiliensis TaxID=676517 RepID=UPI00029B39AB|nr:hypothetical protein [Rickettsiella massiliensis]
MTEVCYLPPAWHYARPQLLTEAIQSCSHLATSKFFLTKIGKVSEKQLRNIISVVQAFLHYTDLATLQYGMWTRAKNVFQRFDLKLIKKITKLSDYYIFGAIKVLKRAGFLFVEKVWTKILPGYFDKSHSEYKKAFKAKTAIRRLTTSFFALLGIDKECLERNQSTAMKKQEERVRQETHKEKSQKSSIWSKIPFFSGSTVSSTERKHHSKAKIAIQHLCDIKSILRRSIQTLGP